MIASYITISELRKAPIRLCRPVVAGKAEYIVTSGGLPIFRISIVREGNQDPQIGINAMRKDLTDFQNLLEKNGAVVLTAYGKKFVRCIKL